MVVSSGPSEPGSNQLSVFCCICSARRLTASARFTSGLSVCRANWWENMIDSTSIPFITTIRQRVYGSPASMSTGSTLSSRQLRNCSSTGTPVCSNGLNDIATLLCADPGDRHVVGSYPHLTAADTQPSATSSGDCGQHAALSPEVSERAASSRDPSARSGGRLPVPCADLDWRP